MARSGQTKSKRVDEMNKQSVDYNLQKARERKQNGKRVKWKVVNGEHIFDGYEK